MATRKSMLKQHVEYHKDGTVWAKGMVADGIPEGYWEWFRKDGTKLRSGTFAKGVQIGEWVTYDKKGREYKVTRMKPKPAAANQPHTDLSSKTWSGLMGLR